MGRIHKLELSILSCELPGQDSILAATDVATMRNKACRPAFLSRIGDEQDVLGGL